MSDALRYLYSMDSYKNSRSLQDDINRGRYLFANVPIIGDIGRAYDNLNWAEDYLRNRNLSWSDVKYPTRVSGSGSGSMLYGFTSDIRAVERLYDQEYNQIRRSYLDDLREEHYRTAINANNMRRAWYYSRM